MARNSPAISMNRRISLRVARSHPGAGKAMSELLAGAAMTSQRDTMMTTMTSTTTAQAVRIAHPIALAHVTDAVTATSVVDVAAARNVDGALLNRSMMNPLSQRRSIPARSTQPIAMTRVKDRPMLVIHAKNQRTPMTRVRTMPIVMRGVVPTAAGAMGMMGDVALVDAMMSAVGVGEVTVTKPTR